MRKLCFLGSASQQHAVYANLPPECKEYFAQQATTQRTVSSGSQQPGYRGIIGMRRDDLQGQSSIKHTSQYQPNQFGTGVPQGSTGDGSKTLDSVF